ncbi:SRPBCC family protein [Mycobacterium spongiae]|nr:SRPBCC family protein [Mycobacterium spongiae]
MELHTEIAINAPASTAWEVLGTQFGEIADWTATIGSSTLEGQLGVGAVRSCQSNGFGPLPVGAVTEEITHFDSEAMELAYVATSGLPPFLREARNSWTIVPNGASRCVATSHARLVLAPWARPLGAIARLQVRRLLRQVGEELAFRVERGEPHPRVAARQQAPVPGRSGR